MPGMVAHASTQEVEIVRDQFEAILDKMFETPSQPMVECGGACLSLQLHREAQIGWPKHKLRPYFKNSQCRAGGVVRVVEHLPNKHRVLGSTLSTDKKKKKKSDR
jgi:hypothetical protein